MDKFHIFQSALKNNKTILLAETSPIEENNAETRISTLKEELTDLLEQNVKIKYVSGINYSAIDTFIENEPTLLVLKANMFTQQAKDWLLKNKTPSFKKNSDIYSDELEKAIATIKRVSGKYNNIESFLLEETTPEGYYEMHPISLKQLQDGFFGFPRTGAVIEGLGKEKSLLKLAENLLPQIRHFIGMDKDAKFIAELSKSYSAGNLQTSEEKTFLFITDRIPELNGKFHVVKDATDITDFSGYHAIFVDNRYSVYRGGSKIGKGIEELKKLKKLGCKLPIFYQTAHKLDALTQEEKRQIESFGDVTILPKNIAPKISLSRNVAEKQVEAGRIISTDPELQRYCTRLLHINGTGYKRLGSRCLTATYAAPIMVREQDNKATLLKSLGIEDNQINTRIYVLAMFHELFKDEMKNQKLQIVGQNYFTFDRIASGLRGNPEIMRSVECLQKSYESAVEYQHTLIPQAIIHNDAKWDNWFNGVILGDFGSVQPGRIARDISKLIIPDVADITGISLAYSKIRSALGTYMEPKELASDIVDNLIIEPLRIASYTARWNLGLTRKLVATSASVSNYSY